MATNAEKLKALRARIERKYSDDTELFPDFTVIRQIDTIASPSVIINACTGIGGFPRGRVTEIYGPFSSGKGLPLDEPVLASKRGLKGQLVSGTQAGFKFIPMGDLTVGDVVVCPDGATSTITATFEAERPVYRAEFEDGSWFRCDDQHQWPVEVNGFTKVEWEYAVLGTERVRELFESGNNVRVPLLKVAPDLGTRSRKCDEERAIDPYMLGLVLGDGGVRSGVDFYSTDDDLGKYAETQGFEEVTYESAKKRQEKTGNLLVREWNLRKKDNRVLWDRWRLSGLRGLTAKDKCVPKAYLNASTKIRLALLQGLMDTDGGLSEDGNGIEFSSKSQALAEDVSFLVRSLGGKARRFETEVEGKTYHRVAVAVQDVPLFRMERKRDLQRTDQRGRKDKRLVRLSKLGVMPTKCIKIDHPAGLFITRDFTVTHNTTIATEVVAAAQQADPNACGLFLDYEHAWDAMYARKLGTDLHPDRLIFAQPTYFEQGADIALDCVRENLVDLLVIDSAAAMTPRSEIEGVMDAEGGTQKGVQAALMARFLERLTKLISQGRKPAVVILNQTRAVISIGGRPQKNAPKEQSAGGNALKFYTTIRIELEITASEGESERGKTGGKGEMDQVYTQNRVRIKVTKNKLAPPFMRGQIVIEYGKGINNLVSIAELAESKLGIMSGAGFFKYEGKSPETSFSCRGREAFQVYLKEHPATLQEIEEATLAAIKQETAQALGLDDIKVQGTAKEVKDTLVLSNQPQAPGLDIEDDE